MATESLESLANSVNQLEVAECPIAKLADEDLAAIFKHLPPLERLIVSEVSRKFRDVSRESWLDVNDLDLSQVPTTNIHAVLKKCPKLSSVSAVRQNLGDLRRFVGHLGNITSLKCVDCTFTSDRNVAGRFSVGASELIWHNSKTVTANMCVCSFEYSLPSGDPNTLRRLQLSALTVRTDEFDYTSEALRLPLLESLIVADMSLNFVLMVDLFSFSDTLSSAFSRELCEGLFAASSLRELYLDSPDVYFFMQMQLMSAWPNLQTIFVDNFDFARISLGHLITKNPSPALRVLVITASRASNFNGEVLIPVRKLFPHGFNAPPVPKLHLFLGKIAAERLRFHPSPTDALEIHPIDTPLPEFLEKEEIKPIFEGSWIASRIKESVKEGANLADYSSEGNAPPISYVQE